MIKLMIHQKLEVFFFYIYGEMIVCFSIGLGGVGWGELFVRGNWYLYVCVSLDEEIR